jgi:TonB dependent receptor
LFEARATAYYQQQSNLPVDVISGATPISANGGEQAGGLFGIARELIDAQFGSYSYREDVGEGYSYGLEMMARRDVGAVTGWIAYTYGRAYRTRDPRLDSVEYPWVLDQPHVLTIVATRPLGDHWRIGGRLRLASGNPITPVAGAYFDQSSHKWVALDGPLLSERLPAFSQLDFRVDRMWRHWDLYFDIQNITNHENVEGVTYTVDYSMRTYTTGLPLLPSIGLIYRAR